jgi:hypothetical protein
LSTDPNGVINHQRIFVQLSVKNGPVEGTLLEIDRNLYHIERAVHEKALFLPFKHERDEHLTLTVGLFTNNILLRFEDWEMASLYRNRLRPGEIVTAPPHPMDVVDHETV